MLRPHAVYPMRVQGHGRLTREPILMSAAEEHLKNIEEAYASQEGPGSGEEITKENIDLVNYVQTRRIYDVLLALLNHFDPGAADEIVELHEQGLFVSPEPALAAQEPPGPDE